MAGKITHRSFLNDKAHGGRAYVRCEVEADDSECYEGHPKKLGVRAEFGVADCSREATLDFNLSGWHEAEAKRKNIAGLRSKAKRLRKAAVWFEKALNRELDRVEASMAVEAPKPEAPKADAVPSPSATSPGTPSGELLLAS